MKKMRRSGASVAVTAHGTAARARRIRTRSTGMVTMW